MKEYLSRIPENKTQLWELIVELVENGLFKVERIVDGKSVKTVYRPNFDGLGKDGNW